MSQKEEEVNVREDSIITIDDMSAMHQVMASMTQSKCGFIFAVVRDGEEGGTVRAISLLQGQTSDVLENMSSAFAKMPKVQADRIKNIVELSHGVADKFREIDEGE